MRVALLVLLLMHSFTSLADQEDSLRTRVAQTSGEQHVMALVDLAHHIENGEPDSAIAAATQAYHLADSLNYIKGRFRSAHVLAMAYNTLGVFDLAEKFYLEAVRIYDEYDVDGDVAATYNGLGITCHSQGKYEQAQKWYVKAITEWEANSNQKSTVLTISNMGALYKDMGHTDEAFKHFNEAIQLAKDHDMKGLQANIYNQLGSIYQEQENYGQAKVYFDDAMKIYTELGDFRGLANSYTNLAIVYFFEEKYTQSKNAFELSLEMRLKAGDPVKIAESYRNLGDYFTYRGAYAAAIPYYQRSIDVAKDANAKPTILEAYMAMSEAYELNGDYKSALVSFKTGEKYSDTLINEANIRSVLDMEAKYELEKKERENESLRKEKEAADRISKEKQARIDAEKERNFWGGLLGSLAILLVAAVAFVMYRGKRKQTKLNVILEEQKEELQNKNEIIEEKNKDITDSIEYAKTLQEVVLPSREQIGKSLDNWFILFKPRDIVSGDFYWIDKIGDNVVTIAADCTGHGVPGAFVSMLGANTLTRIIREKGELNPSRILMELNSEVHKTFQGDGENVKASDGMDLSLCVINEKSLEVKFAGAMNPLIVVRHGELIEYKGDRYPIGGRTPADHPFELNTFKAESGDMIYQFSDGYQDQFGGERGKKFLAGKFRKLLISISGIEVSDQEKLLEDEIVNWMKGYSQIDDILVIGYKVS